MDNNDNEMLTVTEVARQLRCDTTTVRRWIKDGTLPAVTLPHKGRRQTHRIHKSTIDALMNGNSHA